VPTSVRGFLQQADARAVGAAEGYGRIHKLLNDFLLARGKGVGEQAQRFDLGSLVAPLSFAAAEAGVIEQIADVHSGFQRRFVRLHEVLPL